jgi:fluoroquinolone resistance protein
MLGMTSPSIDDLLQESSFQDSTLSRLELESAELTDKEFTHCVFRGLRASGSTWKRVRLEDCVFEDCDLTRAQFPATRLDGVTFRRSKLMGVDWSNAGSNPTLGFEECDLRYASFVKLNLRKTSFRNCKALEAVFIACHLGESDFTDTDLAGANFEDCELTKANLSTARNAFVLPAKNRVKNACISVETAVLLAMSHGMKVAGYTDTRSDGENAGSRGKRR